VRERRLRETLSELQRELERTDAGDAEARRRVAEAAREIDAWLERTGPGSGRPDEGAEESIGDRLRDAALRFEEEHPALATTVRRVIDALSDLGI
jgi:hypothetical protein